MALDDELENVANIDFYSVMDATPSSKTIEFEHDEVMKIKETITFSDPIRDRKEAEEKHKMQELENAGGCTIVRPLPCHWIPPKTRRW